MAREFRLHGMQIGNSQHGRRAECKLCPFPFICVNGFPFICVNGRSKGNE